MITIAEIQKNLEIFNIKKVSEKTGVHVNALYRIKNGETKNPSFETVSKLDHFFWSVKNDKS